jgi:hypothetical protein
LPRWLLVAAVRRIQNQPTATIAAGNAVQAMAANYVQPRTGWFWNPAEGGRGFAIERQGSQLFVAGFMYETTGESTWYVRP